MDDSDMVAVYGHDSREILCDGKGKHYIRFGYDDESIELHFTTCSTWWTDCKNYGPRGKITQVEKSVVDRKIRELIRQRRVKRQKRWIRKIVWWWKYYYDQQLVNCFICANKHCRQLFLLPGDPIVFMEAGPFDVTGLKKWRYLWVSLLVAIWNFVWGLVTAFQLHPPLFDASWRPGYTFHYTCLPEPLKELFREKVEKIVENRYSFDTETYSKFNEQLSPGLGQAIVETIPSLRQAGIEVASAMEIRELLTPSAKEKMADLFQPIEDQIAKTLKDPIEVADMFEDIETMTPKAIIESLQGYRASELRDEEALGVLRVGNHGYWVNSSLYHRLTEMVLGVIRQVDEKLADQYAALRMDFKKFMQFREVFGHELGTLLPPASGGGLNILEFNYRLAQNPLLREDFAPLYRYLEGELKLSPFGATRAWIKSFQTPF